MKKGSIEAMNLKQFSADFINWALTHQLESMEFIVKHYSKKSMRIILDEMLRQMISQFMSQKY
ncbi:hypothetical protein LCGC14_2186220 [marine sediment metagenome]|uniref:Uncharacterized protein n=1 Tax=marine sediment metagenome TaxID=412755 RepID=A0A0F9DKV9_9ZZZZ